MSAPAEKPLLLSRADIADLARVRRPVVSQWAARHRNGATPFPAPAVEEPTALFRGVDVVEWILARGLGNNPSLLEDLAAHAVPAMSAGADEDAVFAGVTALLYVRAALGHGVAGMDAEDLLDEAEELDPDDDLCFSELDGLGADLPALADYADAVVEAAYGAKPAFEAVLARRRRRGGSQDPSALSPEGIAVCSRVLAALHAHCGSAGGAGDAPVVVDAVPGASDVLAAVIDDMQEADGLRVLVPAGGPGGTASSRLTQRRLGVHGWSRYSPLAETEADGADGQLTVDGPAVYFAQLPAAAIAGDDAEAILDAVDAMVVQMGERQWGLVIAPASALIDPLDRSADAIRSGMLRMDVVRAAIRLPAGLLPASAPTRMAMWVLGPADRDVPPADRWTVTADLSARTLDDAVSSVLVADLIAALGARDAVRAHAFGLGAVRRTSSLLASGTLFPALSSGERPAPGAELAARVIAATDSINTIAGTVTNDLAVPVERVGAGSARPADLLRAGDLHDRRLIRRVAGNRIDESHVADTAGPPDPAVPREHGLIRVLGGDRGSYRTANRGIDRLVFATEYPRGRYTEPGDIVVCGDQVAVDAEGLSVVCAPAWVLRCAGPPESTGLLPELIAEHLNAQLDGNAARPGSEWRSWTVPVLAPEDVAGVAAMLDALAERRRAAERLASELRGLSATLVRGIGGGTLKVASDP
ncbi:hypothetical protein [Tomitella gaofuii]|uniref:hypothetical protein n=1 Tax=Tomitella gaofuii TaxID=2760083 RepID=UPI0015F98021|nr:hypothetical protein [Tomitella gaofuii]